MLEVAYTDPKHARTVLMGLPRFDACVIQSTFKTITVEMLAALREKSEVLVAWGIEDSAKIFRIARRLDQRFDHAVAALAPAAAGQCSAGRRSTRSAYPR